MMQGQGPIYNKMCPKLQPKKTKVLYINSYTHKSSYMQPCSYLYISYAINYQTAYNNSKLATTNKPMNAAYAAMR